MSFAHLTLATQDVIASSQFFQQTLGWTPISPVSYTHLTLPTKA